MECNLCRTLRLVNSLKKKKKLKLPAADAQNHPIVYLGWFDYATQKLFVVYPLNGKLLGMACRLTEAKVKQN